MLDQRMPWEKYFMGAAEWASGRASCPRATCGAAIVIGRDVVCTGYNGAPPGRPHCIDEGVGCRMEDGHCQRALHAEVNAIGQAARRGIAVAGATIYIYRANVTSVGDGPCRECQKAMVSAGIYDYHTLDGPGSLRITINGLTCLKCYDQFEHEFELRQHVVSAHPTYAATLIRPHPDCTFPRGGWCCIHGDDCPGSECCYHGTEDNPRPMNYVCGICEAKFPQDSYLAAHIREKHGAGRAAAAFDLNEVRRQGRPNG